MITILAVTSSCGCTKYLLETDPLSNQLMTDGWLKDPQKSWAVRFQRDPQSEQKDVRVLVDHGRKLSQDQPALLKSRRNMRYEDAISLYKELQHIGWTHCEAVW